MARNALAFGFLAFGLLTLALETAAETNRPAWRDPEYGCRLDQMRQRQRKRPDQPLVLVFGSSRAQMGVSPSAMGFPDEPGTPLVYNFGYRGAHPLGVYLQVTRVLDDGVKPRAVLVMLSTVEAKIDGAAEDQFASWAPRLSAADLRRFAPYTKNPAVFQKELTAARRNPWVARRSTLINNYAPDLHSTVARHGYEGWERMDRYGWTPFPAERLDDELRRRLRESVRTHAPAINGTPTGTVSDRALRDLVARCRATGIAVALFWAPESPAYRGMYAAAGRAWVEEYTRTLTTSLGVPVFPAPDHLEEDDFADSYHMMPDGAAKYSRWLADTHLRSWFAETLK